MIDHEMHSVNFELITRNSIVVAMPTLTGLCLKLIMNVECARKRMEFESYYRLIICHSRFTQYYSTHQTGYTRNTLPFIHI